MKSRVLTAFGLIPFVLGAFFCVSPWPIGILGLLVAAACTVELKQLLKRHFFLSTPLMVCFFLFVFSISVRDTALFAVLSVVLVCLASVIGVGATYRASKSPQSSPAVALAPLWFVTPLWCLFALHAQSPHGALWYWENPALLAIVPLWGGDTAGILIGKAFGKRLLAPSISPNKTVEGCAANLVVCIVVSLGLGIWMWAPWWVALICGVCAGVFGQLGDLFESYVKRQAGVKDSGGILPGHGGVLDRMDSILFTAPLVYTVLTLWTMSTPM